VRLIGYSCTSNIKKIFFLITSLWSLYSKSTIPHSSALHIHRISHLQGSDGVHAKKKQPPEIKIYINTILLLPTQSPVIQFLIRISPFPIHLPTMSSRPTLHTEQSIDPNIPYLFTVLGTFNGGISTRSPVNPTPAACSCAALPSSYGSALNAMPPKQYNWQKSGVRRRKMDVIWPVHEYSGQCLKADTVLILL
jgi:hypothetical protein